MRFIIGFVFFGLLFYAMSIYFPEAFQTLVTWAAKLFNYLHDIFNQISNQPTTPPPTTTTPKSLAMLLSYLS